ncbi:hypothetical protein ACWD6I_20310, partial [Streptomyces sp. NPDC002454]
MTPTAGQPDRDRPSAGREGGVLAVDPLLDDPRTRIVVCCGAGGVGKTARRSGRRPLPPLRGALRPAAAPRPSTAV